MRKHCVFISMVLIYLVFPLSSAISAEKTLKNIPPQSLQPKTNSATSKNIDPLPIYLNGPFDTGMQKIPLLFVGHDVERVYNVLEQRKTAYKRNKTETEAEYQNRIAGQRNTPLFESVKEDDFLAFALWPTVSYDQESQTMTIGLPTTTVSVPGRIDNRRLAVAVKAPVSTKETIKGQNTSGKPVEIERTEIRSFDLAVHNYAKFERNSVHSEDAKNTIEQLDPKSDSKKIEAMKTPVLVQKVNLPPDKAKTMRDRFALLIIVRTVWPYTSRTSYVSRPTPADPTSVSRETNYIDVDIEQLWVYDWVSGEVVLKTMADTRI
ncbi:MAG TPA: hypothetical protein VHO84_06450 [Syntrophorhabdaceae bacterium]|nr:hypothetical protein [Syntrophorhabdaceae bacterium]